MLCFDIACGIEQQGKPLSLGGKELSRRRKATERSCNACEGEEHM